MRAFSAIAATLLVVALAGAIFGLLGGSRKSPHGASSTPTPSGCVPSKVSASFPAHFLASDLAMVSPDEGWLIGPINGQTRNAVILHYAHCAWQQVPGIISGFDLDSIVMVSPSDGWISGMDGSGTQSIVLHLVGGTWMRVPTLGNPAADTAQGRFAMETGKQPWLIAIGNKVQGHGHFTSTLYHYAAGRWTIVPTPMPQVNFVTSLGPDDAWITGGPDAGGDNHIIAHYVQGKWVTWNLSGLSVWSLVMQSQTDGWTVATRFPWVNQHDPGPPAVPLHFDGTSWRAVPLPSNVPAQDVQLLSPDDGWAFQHAPKGDPNSPDYAIIGDHIIRAWHLQAGQWQPVAWPLSNIIGVRFWQPVAANEYWALADAYDKTFPLDQHSLGPPPGGPVLIHYVNSHFYVYGEPANWTAPPATASATAGG